MKHPSDATREALVLTFANIENASTVAGSLKSKCDVGGFVEPGKW